MNTQTTHAPLTPRLHPLLAIAAFAVTTFSLAGIAAMSGWLPMSQASAPQTAVTAIPPVPNQRFPAVTSSFAENTPVSPPKVVEKMVIVEKPVYRAAPKIEAKTPAMPPLETSASTRPPVLAASPVTAPQCFNCGTIDNVREVMREGEGSGLGAVIGGVLGGLLGSQVGGGSGKKIAAVLGAAGGAYAGHQVEKTRKQTANYEISVRMEDGSLRTISQDSIPTWRIGDHVNLDNGRLTSRVAAPSTTNQLVQDDYDKI